MAAGKIKVFMASNTRRGRALRAMWLGARRMDLDCAMVEPLRYEPSDVAVVWGMPKEESSKSAKGRERQRFRHDLFNRHRGPVVVMDAPVIGRRMRPSAPLPWWLRKLPPREVAWASKFLPVETGEPIAHYRIGLGSFPDEGALALAPFCSGRWDRLARWLGHPKVKPWRTDGRHILVIGQAPGDAALRGVDMNAWLLATALELREKTDRPITLRPHPRAGEFGDAVILALLKERWIKLEDAGTPIAECLEGAWSAVTYSSGAAIEALMAGIPAISLSPASFAWTVTDHAIADAVTPTLHDRAPWLEKIAAAQWCEDEIVSGAVWVPLAEAIAAAGTKKRNPSRAA
jgi:hypothetical protein